MTQTHDPRNATIALPVPKASIPEQVGAIVLIKMYSYREQIETCPPTLVCVCGYVCE